MSHEILDIHKPSNFKFDSKYLLSYFYYAGCVYGAMKLYDSALFYLEQALTMPAMALSQIMIESYKKFILMSLISKGKMPSLPKYTSWIVINQLKPLCSIYYELATAFNNFDLEKLNMLCHRHQRAFEVDQNVGLVKQLQNSFYKKNIQKLTKTYITLSLSDMAAKVSLPSAAEAESYLLNMIRDGEIFATINQKDGKRIVKKITLRKLLKITNYLIKVWFHFTIIQKSTIIQPLWKNLQKKYLPAFEWMLTLKLWTRK